MWQCASQASGGSFDVTVAPELVCRGYLPRPAAPELAPGASWEDIELLPACRVRLRRPLWIDLGGIAKGYAVDAATAALRGVGIGSGLVNAGGDLRAFGDTAWPVAVRDPARPGVALRLPELRNMSLATSAWMSEADDAIGRGPHIDPWRRQDPPRFASVSVVAATCMMADALTKVVMAQGAAAIAVLERFGARALTIGTDGSVQASSATLLARARPASAGFAGTRHPPAAMVAA